MKLFDLINPVKIMALYTLYGGGSGGGGGTDTRYANLDKLYGIQSQASQYMLDNAMPYVSNLTSNSAGMVDEAMSGALASRLRRQAGADANEGIASSNRDAIRNLQTYGALGDPSGGRYADTINNNAINSAKTRAGAMNKANTFAEDQKWNRNANFYGQVMGMNNGAMSGLSSSAAGMGNVAGQQNQMDAANARGYGQAGAAFGSALMKADGGYIKPAKLAKGGDAWAAYKSANPTATSSYSGKKANPYASMLGGAAPSMLGAGVKDVFSDKSKIIGGVKKGYDYAKSAYDTYQAAQAAQEYADAAQTINDGVSAANATVDALDAANSVGAGLDAANSIGTGVEVADTINSGVQAADTASKALEAVDTINSIGGFAKGGYIPKRNGYALGGLANTSVAKSNSIDNQSLAAMDASNAMSLAKMDDKVTAPQQGVKRAFDGRTDGMGESSTGDPDGFGKYGGDNRHMAGKGTLSAVGYAFSIPGLGLVADVLHPVAEPLTRGLVREGDKRAGVGGAMTLDPAAAIASGKYSNKDLVKGALLATSGLGWTGLADGGRVDFEHGGDVAGPGTETSDDIPAWLSDGEYVLNAEAVKMVGKKKLDKINDAGLKKRGGDGPGLGDANKAGVKLAGGGFLGGNLGIAMGAGVDQWNRQQVLDRGDEELALRKQQAAQQQEQFGWQRQQHEAAQRKQAGLDAISAEYAPKVQALARGDMSGFVKADGTQMSPEEAQNHLMNSYHAANASMGGAGLSDFVKYTSDQRKMANEEKRWKTDEEYKKGNLDLSRKQLEQKIEQDKIDADLRRKQISISGGHLGLAQQKWNEELKELGSERQVKAKVRELKNDLANTTDESARAVLKQKLEDLSGAGKTDYRYHATQGEDESGRKVTNVVDRNTGVLYPGGVKPAQPAAAKGARPPLSQFQK